MTVLVPTTISTILGTDFLATLRDSFNTNASILYETLELQIDSTDQDVNYVVGFDHTFNTRAIIGTYLDNENILQTLVGIMQMTTTGHINFNFNTELVGTHTIFLTFLKQ